MGRYQKTVKRENIKPKISFMCTKIRPLFAKIKNALLPEIFAIPDKIAMSKIIF